MYPKNIVYVVHNTLENNVCGCVKVGSWISYDTWRNVLSTEEFQWCSQIARSTWELSALTGLPHHELYATSPWLHKQPYSQYSAEFKPLNSSKRPHSAKFNILLNSSKQLNSVANFSRTLFTKKQTHSQYSAESWIPVNGLTQQNSTIAECLSQGR